MNLEEIREEANQLSEDDLRELADFCLALADAIEGEQ